jgi:hypothetical protein
MQQEENSPEELEALQKVVPFAPFRDIKTLDPFDLNAYYSALEEKTLATSYGMGWKGLQAVRSESPGGEFSVVIAPSTHLLVLSVRPPEKMDVRYEGVKQDMPPPAGSIAVVPAGSSVLARWQGSKDSLLIYLEPSLVTRVAAESFELDPTRTEVPPLVGLNVPELRSAMLAVDAELRADGRVTGQRFGRSLDPSYHGCAAAAGLGGRSTSAPEAPDSHRLHHGKSRRQSDAGANGCRRSSQSLSLCAPVQGGHWVAAAPVCHRVPR